ncbi:hypothetical protein Dimus_037590 [Dionaea muscipula]
MTRGFPARVPSLGVSSMLADQLMLKQNHLLPLECLSRNICCQHLLVPLKEIAASLPRLVTFNRTGLKVRIHRVESTTERGELPRTIRKWLNFRCTKRLVSLTGLFWEKERDFSLINCHCMWKKHRNLQSVEGRPKSPPKKTKFASIDRCTTPSLPARNSGMLEDKFREHMNMPKLDLKEDEPAYRNKVLCRNIGVISDTRRLTSETEEGSMRDRFLYSSSGVYGTQRGRTPVGVSFPFAPLQSNGLGIPPNNYIEPTNVSIYPYGEGYYASSLHPDGYAKAKGAGTSDTKVSLMESGHQEPSGQHLLGTSTIGFADVITRNEFGVWEIFLPNNPNGSLRITHAPGQIPHKGIYYDPPEEKRFGTALWCKTTHQAQQDKSKSRQSDPNSSNQKPENGIQEILRSKDIDAFTALVSFTTVQATRSCTRILGKTQKKFPLAGQSKYRDSSLPTGPGSKGEGLDGRKTPTSTGPIAKATKTGLAGREKESKAETDTATSGDYLRPATGLELA